MKQTDVAVIGGGAAGLCAAVRLKQICPALSVAVFEQSERVGRKLSTTGNGRCNITNAQLSAKRYHGKDPCFCMPLITRYGGMETARFFESVGILFTFDETGRGYPYSLQASSVVDALRFAAEESGVDLKTGCAVTDLAAQNGRFLVTASAEKFSARAVLVATGLYAGGEKIGADGKIFQLLKRRGYQSEPVTPAIVQLKTEPDQVRALKGVKVNGTATLYCGDRAVRSESGEILFCDYGLSGPPILQLARPVEREQGKFSVSLDLMPQDTVQTVARHLQKRTEYLKKRQLDEFLTGFLQKRVGQTLLKSIGLRLADGVDTLTEADLRRLAEKIKDWRFAVTGTTGFLHAQVTAGGLSTDAFDTETLMSKRDKGLFAAGEILDVDGDCGGFNLQWAWSSGLGAAAAIAAYLGETPC